jgi:hypothetical protein
MDITDIVLKTKEHCKALQKEALACPHRLSLLKSFRVRCAVAACHHFQQTQTSTARKTNKNILRVTWKNWANTPAPP